MSYILEALRRADRERHSLEMPTVHTVQAARDLLPDDEQATSPWVWAMGLAVVALLGLALWAWWTQPPANLDTLPAPGAGVSQSGTMPPLAPREMPAQVVAALGDAPGPAVIGADTAPPPSAPPAPVTAAAAPVRRSPATAEPVVPALRLDATVQATKVAPPALPPALRSEWGLSVDGAIYSERRQDRMLIVGGQLFREREKLRDDVVLESIQPKSAVIRQNGQRYTVAF
jgi:general secretion pathway protein B